MDIFNVIFPIFAIALAGYLVAYIGVISSQDIQGLSKFVYKVAFPVLLFKSISSIELPEQVDWKFLLSYYLVALVMFALGMLIFKFKFFTIEKDQVIFGLGSSFSNLVLVGLPILSSGLGEQSIIPLFMIVSIHSAILLTLASILIERGEQSGVSSRLNILWNTIRTMTRNPIIMSLFIGFVFNLLKIPIPAPLVKALEIFSGAALPCALFMLGAFLTQYKVAGYLVESITMVGLKMVLQPFLVWVMAFLVFHVDPIWGRVAVLAAGMPIGVNTYLLAQSFQAETKALSAAILLSSLFTIINQSMMLSLFI